MYRFEDKLINKDASGKDFDCFRRKFRPNQLNVDVWNKFRKIYAHPHHIDLFAGGMSEKPFGGEESFVV